MTTLRRIDEGLARGEAALTATVLLAMIFVAAFQALLRNCSDMGFVWASNLLPSISWVDQFLMKGTLWVAFLGASLATHDDKHIAIDILPRLASPKVRAVMRGIVGVTVGGICLQYGRVIMRTILNNASEFVAIGGLASRRLVRDLRVQAPAEVEARPERHLAQFLPDAHELGIAPL